jgi:hypothetical protein
MPVSKKWSKHFNDDFARVKTPFVGLVLFLSMGDISLIQMLPWNESFFHTESKGFPCLSLLQLSLGVDTLQASVSVICQIIYLAMNRTATSAATSQQAKALFGLNISTSIIFVLNGILMLYLKESLMKQAKRKSRSQARHGSDGATKIEEQVEDDDEEEAGHVELGTIDLVYTDNPLHVVERTDELNVVAEGKSTSGAAGEPWCVSTVPYHEHQRIIARNDELRAEVNEVEEKQEVLQSEMETWRTRAINAEAELAEVKEKINGTEGGVL